MLALRAELRSRVQPIVGDVAWVLARRVRRFLWQELWWRRRVVSVAPHEMALYRTVVQALLKDSRVELFLASAHTAGEHRRDRVNVVLRHDVDFEPERLFALTGIELGCGLRSTVYVRADGEAYRLADFGDRLRGLAETGFEIGLHSCAYAADTPGWFFIREMRAFREALGFSPLTVTTHGVHPFSLKLAVRHERFLRDLGKWRMGGIRSDEFPGNGFDRYIVDSNFSRGRTYTYITQEFLEILSLPAGWRVLLLTHPEYWGP